MKLLTKTMLIGLLGYSNLFAGGNTTQYEQGAAVYRELAPRPTDLQIRTLIEGYIGIVN